MLCTQARLSLSRFRDSASLNTRVHCAELPGAALYLLRDEYRSLVSTSTMSLLVSTVPAAAPAPPVEVYLLVLDDFQVVCSAATVVLQISAGQYLFPGDECTRAVLLPPSADAAALEALEAVLAAHCTFRRAPRAPPILSIPDVRTQTASAGMVWFGLVWFGFIRLRLVADFT